MVVEAKEEGADPRREVEACTQGPWHPGSLTSAIPRNHHRIPSYGPSAAPAPGRPRKWRPLPCSRCRKTRPAPLTRPLSKRIHQGQPLLKDQTSAGPEHQDTSSEEAALSPGSSCACPPGWASSRVLIPTILSLEAGPTSRGPFACDRNILVFAFFPYGRVSCTSSNGTVGRDGPPSWLRPGLSGG